VASYFACRWHHEADDDPVMLYEELDDDRMETRKVHEFRDGTLERTDAVRPEHRTSLAWEAVPALEDIDAQPDFTVLPLTAEDFDAVWKRAGA
jgi:hypothetical protein